LRILHDKIIDTAVVCPLLKAELIYRYSHMIKAIHSAEPYVTCELTPFLAVEQADDIE
jgi:hypothetical protein